MNAPQMNGAVALISIPTMIAAGILLAGVADDLRSRKFHNWLFLTCSGAALAGALAGHGWYGFVHGALGFAAGVGALLPFVLARAIGAGDMKLLGAFGIIAGWQITLCVALYALGWGAVFGVLRALVTGQAAALANNVAHIAVLGRGANLKLQKFPYTIAIVLGWLSYLTIGGP